MAVEKVPLVSVTAHDVAHITLISPAAQVLGGPPVAGAAVDRTQAREAYGRLPLSFELNAGQVDPQVKFMARGRGYSLFLKADEAAQPSR